MPQIPQVDAHSKPAAVIDPFKEEQPGG
jgi:hypothetical protein